MGKKRRFTVEFQATVEIELDEDLIRRSLTPEWHDSFYALYSAGEVAGHVAYNMVINELSLKQMDGFADLNEDLVGIVSRPGWDVASTEEDLRGHG